jgi:hypothetical protein
MSAKRWYGLVAKAVFGSIAPFSRFATASPQVGKRLALRSEVAASPFTGFDRIRSCQRSGGGVSSVRAVIESIAPFSRFATASPQVGKWRHFCPKLPLPRLRGLIVYDHVSEAVVGFRRKGGVWIDSPLQSLRDSFPTSGEAIGTPVRSCRFPVHGEAPRSGGGVSSVRAVIESIAPFSRYATASPQVGKRLVLRLELWAFYLAIFALRKCR